MPGAWHSLDLSTAHLMPADNPYGQYDGTGIKRLRGWPDFRIPAMPTLDPDSYYDFEFTYDGAYNAPGTYLYSQLSGDFDDAYNDSFWYELKSFNGDSTIGQSYVLSVGPLASPEWGDAVDAGEHEILFESYGGSDGRLIGIRWRTGDPPAPPPGEMLEPLEGSNYYQNARTLPCAIDSYPTSTVGLDNDPAFDPDSGGWSAYKTMWWRIDVPSTWSGGSWRFDLRGSSLGGVPAGGLIAQAYTGSVPSLHNTWGSLSSLDLDTFISSGTSTIWFKIGLRTGWESNDVTIVLNQGPLVLTPGAHSDPITPPPLKVRPDYVVGGNGQLFWPTDPLPDVGDTLEPGTTEEVMLGWKNWANPSIEFLSGTVAIGSSGAEWSVFNFGHDDWPLVPSQVEELVNKDQTGTGVNVGSDSPQDPAGKQRYGSWGFSGSMPSGNLGGFARREWGHISVGGAGVEPAANTQARGVYLNFQKLFSESDPDLYDSSAYSGPWFPGKQGYTNPFDAFDTGSWEVITPGERSNPVIEVALELNVNKTGEERVVVGISRGLPSETIPAYADVVGSLHVIGVWNPPTVDQTGATTTRMEVVFKADIPEDIAYDPDTDKIVLLGSPSLFPTWGSLPSEPGFTPTSYGSAWADRYGPLVKTYPDFSEDIYQFDVGAAYTVEYDYQPPTFRWTGTSRGTECLDDVPGRLMVDVNYGTGAPPEWHHAIPDAGEVGRLMVNVNYRTGNPPDWQPLTPELGLQLDLNAGQGEQSWTNAR